MSTDLIVPLTGELVDLQGPTDTLAAHMHEVQRIESDLRAAKAVLRAELVSRMDKELARTFQAGEFFLECDAPGQTEYDANELDRVVARLVKEDKIGFAAAAQALKVVETVKPMKRGIDKLLAAPSLTDEDRAEVLACAHPKPGSRTLRVKRAGD